MPVFHSALHFKIQNLISVVTLLVVITGCARSSNSKVKLQHGAANDADSLVKSIPLAEIPSDSPVLFEKLLPERSGVTATSSINTSHPLKHLYVGAHACGGIAVGDIDGDNRPDLFVVNNAGANQLYRNLGDFRFRDITPEAEVDGGDAWGAGAAMVDIDGDGDLDIYVCNYLSPNQLFINDGKSPPHFTEQASAFQLDINDASLMPYFCDYDRDGDLDVYLVCYRHVDPGGIPKKVVFEQTGGELRVKPRYAKLYDAIPLANGKVYVTARGAEDYLLRNDSSAGGTRFTNVTAEAGISGQLMGNSAVWWDYDEDGWPDIYVANDFEHADRLYRNRGDGTFINVIREVVPHSTYYSMGTAIADFDGNNHLDCIVLDMASTTHFKEKVNMGEMTGLQQVILDYSEPRQAMRNALYLNTGTGRMQEGAFLAGIAKTDWSWSPVAGDFDNDGLIDLFVTNGMSRNFMDSDVAVQDRQQYGTTEWDVFEMLSPYPEQNLAYHNRGDLAFDNVSQTWGVADVAMSFAAATGDFDGDGRLDLVVANLDAPIGLYRNRGQNTHRCVISLRSHTRNTYGIGATLTLTTSTRTFTRVMQPAMGFAACNEPLVHFGLEKENTIRSLRIDWPDGTIQTLPHLAADSHLTIRQPHSTAPNSNFSNPPASAEPPSSTPPPPRLRERPPFFARHSMIVLSPHVESAFDDFSLQPLLPNRYSQLGPAIAWGDVNADGYLDFYHGGAAGQSGQLYLGTTNASYFKTVEHPFKEDADAEDMGAVMFDADRDGDLDLYVVSGSYEFASDDQLLADRLYLNEGQGRFARASDGAIPMQHTAGGPVAAADFDRDGDLDLFVGGRVVPGDYPRSPTSALLVNESQNQESVRFIDRTQEVAPEIQLTGMVTSALWSDVNNDTWLDLLVTHEWGPVKLFVNERGVLRDRTAESGLSSRLGWWNSIVGGDVDGDGDMDYVVGNFGLNTKYRADADHPLELYYGDFAGDGTLQLVEAKHGSDGKLLPVRGRSCSSTAMPHLKGKFTSFQAFASASLQEIYTDECLNQSLRLSVNCLESGVLLNETSDTKAPEFRFQSLPRLAQLSPIFGLALVDVDGDRKLDLYATQNFFSPQRETGRMDGGVSLLMIGHGNGSFEPVAPSESALIVPDDAKSLGVVDLNRDGRPDFIVGNNNAALKSFVSTDHRIHRPLAVVLRGKAGNTEAVGARVYLEHNGERRLLKEFTSTSGYLSQSPPQIFLNLDALGPNPTTSNSRVDSLLIVWPDGHESQHAFNERFENGATWVITEN